MNSSQKYFQELYAEAKRPREELVRKEAAAMKARGDVIGSQKWRDWQFASYALIRHDKYFNLATATT